MKVPPEISQYMARNGKKGGKATGDAKRRSAEFYAANLAKARAAKKRKASQNKA